MPDHGLLSRERLVSLALIGATALVLYLCYRLVEPFLSALAWALALAVVVAPAHKWLSLHVRSDGLAALIAVLVVALLIIAPMAVLAEQLAAETAAGIAAVRSEAGDGGFFTGLQEHRWVRRGVEWVQSHVDVKTQSERLASAAANAVTALVAGSANAALQLVIALFVLFFFLRDEKKILHAARSVIPLEREETDKVFRRIADTVQATVHGTIGIAAFKGVLGGVIFAVLGIPGAALWGFAMAIASVLPVVGTGLVWAPASVYLLVAGHWVRALILALYGLLVLGLSDNILYPVLVGGRMRMHALLVFFAILGGMSVFGASGLILGPVIVAVMLALLDEWRRRTRTIVAPEPANATVSPGLRTP